MRRHLKTHSGEKSGKCNQCNFASTWPADLRIHFISHSGIKPVTSLSQCMCELQSLIYYEGYLTFSRENLLQCSQFIQFHSFFSCEVYLNLFLEEFEIFLKEMASTLSILLLLIYYEGNYPFIPKVAPVT